MAKLVGRGSCQGWPLGHREAALALTTTRPTGPSDPSLLIEVFALGVLTGVGLCLFVIFQTGRPTTRQPVGAQVGPGHPTSYCNNYLRFRSARTTTSFMSRASSALARGHE